MTAYVRVENASSVHVTESFLREWQQAPSIALDVWRGGNLTLDPTPEHDNIKRFASYKTFVGRSAFRLSLCLSSSFYVKKKLIYSPTQRVFFHFERA